MDLTKMEVLRRTCVNKMDYNPRTKKPQLSG